MNGGHLLRDAFRRMLGLSHSTRGVLGTAADLLAIGTLVYSGFALVFGVAVQQAVLAAFVCTLCAVLLAIVLRRDLQYGRRVRESNALPTLASAVGTLAQATHSLRNGGHAQTFVVELKNALMQLADALGTATGVACTVTVKITYQPTSEHRLDLAVKTVCRSRDRSNAPNVPPIDWVDENTDFRDILRAQRPHFFCNDLATARVTANYRNSRFTDEVVRTGQYPYLSAIVWPVRGRSSLADEQWDLIGFLCVDSAKKESFDEVSDVAFGAAFADALYSGLLRYRDDEGGAAQRLRGRDGDAE